MKRTQLQAEVKVKGRRRFLNAGCYGGVTTQSQYLATVSGACAVHADPERLRGFTRRFTAVPKVSRASVYKYCSLTLVCTCKIQYSPIDGRDSMKI